MTARTVQRRVRIVASPRTGRISKRKRLGTSSTAQRVAKNVDASGRITALRLVRGHQHEGTIRRNGNPHSTGYSCREADDLEPAEYATLASGKPSFLRCIWRGLYRVRGKEGKAKEEGLRGGPRRIVYRYSQQGGLSIYQMLNRILARAKGRDLKPDLKAREWAIQLVMAVRLLWSPTDQRSAKVYRGVRSADLRIYEHAKAQGSLVQWDAFSSTSRSRKVANRFRKGGVLFVIRRDIGHAAAADISGYSNFPDEEEVLLLPGMRFRVVDIHHKQEGTEVVLDEINVFPSQLR